MTASNPTLRERPTRAQLKALLWFRQVGKACMFGRGDPTLAMVKSLHSIGWLEMAGSESGRLLGLTYYRLTDEGRTVLAESEGR